MQKNKTTKAQSSSFNSLHVYLVTQYSVNGVIVVTATATVAVVARFELPSLMLFLRCAVLLSHRIGFHCIIRLH